MQALLPEHSGTPGPIHIVYPAKRLLPRRAAVFMDFIAEAFSREPVLNEGGLKWLLSRRHARKSGTRSGRR